MPNPPGEAAMTLPGFSGCDQGATWHPDSRHALIFRNGGVALIDAQAAQVEREFAVDGEALDAAVFNPAGDHFMALFTSYFQNEDFPYSPSKDYNWLWIFDLRQNYSYSIESDSDGTKTLYVRLRNAAGTSAVASASIGLDTKRPSTPSAPVSLGGSCSEDSVAIFDWTPSSPLDDGIGVTRYRWKIKSARTGLLLDSDETTATALAWIGESGEGVQCSVQALDGFDYFSVWPPCLDPVWVVPGGSPATGDVRTFGALPERLPGLSVTPEITVALDEMGEVPVYLEIAETPDFADAEFYDFYTDAEDEYLRFASGESGNDVAFSPDGARVVRLQYGRQWACFRSGRAPDSHFGVGQHRAPARSGMVLSL